MINLLVSVLPLLVSSMMLSNPAPDSLNGNVNDGPYIRYRNEQIEVRHIAQEDGRPKAHLAVFKASEKARIPVKISFPAHPEWNFSVKLQQELKDEPAEFAQPGKLLALSDIEGEFEAFRNLLLANKVIDKNYNWIFGKGHLVICGDLFDRGKEVSETLWLLYKLEQDAKAKGGYLHTILGNHDIMNLSGDLRYLQPKYLEHAKLMGLDYMELYAADTELGRWLRSKNLIEKIGENLCLHAGVAPEINGLKMTLKEINERCRPYYDQAKKKASFQDKAVFKFFDGTRSSLFWYRGYFHEPKATEAELEETLNIYQVKRVIVGHTIVASNVGFYYNGKVLGIDVNQHEGKHEGALYENQNWYKISTTGKKENISVN